MRRSTPAALGVLLVGAVLALPLAARPAPAQAQALVPAHGSPGPTGSPMPGMDHDMGGMDMGDMHGMDMDGVDHGSSSGHDSGHDHGSGSAHEDMPGMSHDDGPAPSRPRGVVLGGFAAVNGAVMGSAAVLRHRTKGKPTGRRAQAQRRRAAGARAASTRKAGGR